MKQLFRIEDSVANKASYYHLAFFLVALPFDFFYSELILISFGIHTLIHLQTNNLRRILQKPVLVLCSLFVLSLLAVSYSPDKQEALNIITRQLAILLFPLLFSISDLDMKKYRLNLFCIFGFTCVITTVYLYADALRTLHYFHLPLSGLFSNLFMNHNFSLPIGIHATYLSMYVAFSLILFLYLLFKKEQPGNKWIYIISCLILFAGLVQLSSRAVFIAFLMLINLAFPFFLFNGKKKWTFFAVATIFSVFTLLIIVNVDSFKTRYISELKTDLTNNVKVIENTEPRLARWEVIAALIKRSPLIGYGTGSEKELLKQKYFEKGLYISYLNEFNTHSQYLGILLKTGVIGLALFLYILYFGFRSAVQKRDLLFLSFMILIAVVSVSENVLELNKGVFFYSFFFSLFLWKTRPVSIEEIKETHTKTGNRAVLKPV